MENQDQNIKTENEKIIPKTRPKKRKKKTVSDIELQIKELQKKKIDSATTVISVLSDKLEFFGPDKETEDRLKKLKLYRITIMELDKDPKWPYVEFPEMP